MTDPACDTRKWLTEHIHTAAHMGTHEQNLIIQIYEFLIYLFLTEHFLQPAGY
jgi:hypothetical protein